MPLKLLWREEAPALEDQTRALRYSRHWRGCLTRSVRSDGRVRAERKLNTDRWQDLILSCSVQKQACFEVHSLLNVWEYLTPGCLWSCFAPRQGPCCWLVFRSASRSWSAAGQCPVGAGVHCPVCGWGNWGTEHLLDHSVFSPLPHPLLRLFCSYIALAFFSQRPATCSFI